MAKFDLYEKPVWPVAAPRAPSSKALQFAGAVALWFLLVFFVGYMVLAL